MPPVVIETVIENCQKVSQLICDHLNLLLCAFIKKDPVMISFSCLWKVLISIANFKKQLIKNSQQDQKLVGWRKVSCSYQNKSEWIPAESNKLVLEHTYYRSVHNVLFIWKETDIQSIKCLQRVYKPSSSFYFAWIIRYCVDFPPMAYGEVEQPDIVVTPPSKHQMVFAESREAVPESFGAALLACGIKGRRIIIF